MKNSSLSIIDRVDPATHFIYRHIGQAAMEVGADWLVVGAAARDMIYHIAFGTPVKRATKDIDFGIRVADWDMYSRLTRLLVDKYDFTHTKSKHRLNLPDSKLWLDIIPFGEIAGKDDKYSWPGEPDTEISVLGFTDAMRTAISCRLTAKPTLDVKVVHPTILIILKVISWCDRKQFKKTDAQDVAYALHYYGKLDDNELRIYDDPEIYEHDFELDTIGARLAGRDMANLAPGRALEFTRELLTEEIERGDKSEFLADMMLGTTKLFADESMYRDLLTNLVKGINEGNFTENV